MVSSVGQAAGDDEVAAAKTKEPISDEQKRVTAILVQTKGTGPAQKDAIAFLMKPLINKGAVFQAVNPIEQITKLLRDVVGNIRTMLLVMTVLIIVVSGIRMSSAFIIRCPTVKTPIAIMRALGARRQTVFSIIVAEAVLLCAGGGLAGLLLGHGLVFIAGPIVEAKSDILRTTTTSPHCTGHRSRP